MHKDVAERTVRVDVLRDEEDRRQALYEATARALRGDVKQLPTVWLYDEVGSQLYERITRLPEYYLPRREGEILRAHVAEIAGRTQTRTLVELGAGRRRTSACSYVPSTPWARSSASFRST
jgi:uncharacterized SAM-dependent methyltransferase